MFSLSDLEAELAEIDENLERCPLNDLEYSQHLDRRKTIYEELHPETKQGVAGGTASGQARNGESRNKRHNVVRSRHGQEDRQVTPHYRT